MNRASFMPWDLVKETRGMLPAYLGCYGMLMFAGLNVPFLQRFSVPAYFIGVGGLGALSVGQEFAYGTLPMLLGQAVSRRRLFAIKMGTLAWMLATLTIGSPILWDRSQFGPRALAILPFLCGMCLAPWLTMMSRSTIAGAVFCFGLPGTVFVTTQLLYFWATGATLDGRESTTLLFWETSAVCAIGAVMTYRTFMRLEVIDGGTSEIQLPGWLASRTTAIGVSRQHPVWMLIKKELGLQQITVILAALFVAGSIGAFAVKDIYAHTREIFSVMTVIYCSLTIIVVGALASAEERQLGTHEWQTLMPVSARTQWIVKAGTVFALTLGLGLLLPALLGPWVEPALNARRFFDWEFVLVVAILAAGGLHASSMSTSGVRALLLFFPVAFLVVLPASLAMQVATRRTADRPIDWLHRYISANLYRAGIVSRDARSTAMVAMAVVLSALLIALLLFYGYRNHRSADGATRPKWAQLALIGSAASLTVLLMLAIGTMP